MAVFILQTYNASGLLWVIYFISTSLDPSNDPLIFNIPPQILLSYCHTLHIVETGGQLLNLLTEFMLSDNMFYSHDFSDLECVDIIKRNLKLITIGT